MADTSRVGHDGQRVAPLAITLAIGASIAALACLVHGAADILAARDPQTAADWRIADGDALSALAEKKLTDATLPDRLATAERYARAALIAAPLDPRAVRVLALAAEIGGDRRSPLRLMQVGDELSRRDPITQVWLFEHALQGRDWPQASLHADALLRADQLQGPLTAAMIHVMGEPGGLSPFVDRLAANPVWRRPFMSSLTWGADDRALPARVLAMLASTSAPPTSEETGRLIDRFVSDRDYQGARALWLKLLPRGQAAPRDQVYNSDFAILPALPPFNWRLSESDAAEAGFGHAEDGRHALHVLVRGPVSDALAEEALILPPGRYRLSLTARFEPGQEGDAFAWRVACAETPSASLAEIRENAGPRQISSADFQVPAAGCGAQWLRLYVPLPRADLQPAEAWFSNLNVIAQG